MRQRIRIWSPRELHVASLPSRNAQKRRCSELVTRILSGEAKASERIVRLVGVRIWLSELESRAGRHLELAPGLMDICGGLVRNAVTVASRAPVAQETWPCPLAVGIPAMAQLIVSCVPGGSGVPMCRLKVSVVEP